MSVSLIAHNKTNCAFGNAEVLSEINNAFAGGKPFADFAHIVRSQFTGASIFADHIKCVLSRSASKQMMRIAASAIIAFVAYVQGMRIGAVMQNISYAMSVKRSMADACLAVTVSLNALFPGPALINPSSVNVRPEAVDLSAIHRGDWARGVRMMLSHLYLLLLDIFGVRSFRSVIPV